MQTMQQAVHIGPPFCVTMKGAEGMDNIKITWVNMDDANCDEQGDGIVIIVEFNNGAGITFTLDSITDNPLINAVKQGMGGKCVADERYIRWRNGASLSIKQMMDLVLAETNTQTAG